MGNNKQDRGNSSEQRKKLSYAKTHMKGKKYTVVRPEHRTKYTEPDDNALNMVLDTLTGGHHDTVRRFDDASKPHNAQVYDAPDTEKIRQKQKARFIQQQLESEQKASVYVKLDEMSYQPEKPHDSGGYGTQPNIFDDGYYGTQPNMYDKADHAWDVSKKYGDRSNELSVYPDSRKISDDSQLVERLRKAQYIREQLENSTAVSAYMSHSDEDISDTPEYIAEPSYEERVSEQHTFRKDSAINSMLSSMIPMLSDEQKADIQRSIKQKQYESRLEERRQTEETTSAPVTAVDYADDHYNNSSDTSKSDTLDEVG